MFRLSKLLTPLAVLALLPAFATADLVRFDGQAPKQVPSTGSFNVAVHYEASQSTSVVVDVMHPDGGNTRVFGTGHVDVQPGQGTVQVPVGLFAQVPNNQNIIVKAWSVNSGVRARDPNNAWTQTISAQESQVTVAGASSNNGGGFDAGSDYNFVWGDDFNGNELDRSVWQYDIGRGPGNGWGNGELEYYTDSRSNSWVQDGKLIIKAQRENMGGAQFTSARINTKGRKSFKFGKFAARIKAPVANGLWPAFWTLGSSIDQVGWPSCGEIDIMEIKNGREDGQGNQVYGTLHFNPNPTPNPYGWVYHGGNTKLPNGQFFDGDFHVFWAEWTPERAWAGVDGNRYFQIDFDNGNRDEFGPNAAPFFLLLNLALGGNFPQRGPDGNFQSAQMEVDWVKVWQKKGGVNSGDAEDAEGETEQNSGAKGQHFNISTPAAFGHGHSTESIIEYHHKKHGSKKHHQKKHHNSEEDSVAKLERLLEKIEEKVEKLELKLEDEVEEESY